ncbi:MAG: hypothetical protein F6K58_13170 [Symploca sp. SIO2E9]|nr:hypothetical protein [Symploca sp. SIO2E9]
MNNQLIYPTVDLFLYDLGNGLGQSSKKIAQNRQRFWQRIYQDNLSEQKLTQLQAEEGTFSSYIELLGTQRVEYFKHPLDGYYYPVKLGDTYALQIDCAGKENDQDWEQLSTVEQLEQLKEIVLNHTHNLPGEMGQTWLIWGKLANPSQYPETIAKEYYQALTIVPKPKWQRDCKGKGTFQGATIFELEQPDKTPDGFNRNYHIIICLFPYNQTEEQIEKTIGKLYRHFIRLFHYRNKILWVYEQSRQLKDTLKKTYSTIQKIVNFLPQHLASSYINLNQLQQNLADTLSASYQYETRLVSLHTQISTIETNVKNYQSRIQVMAKADANSDLTFLERFGEFAQDKYLNQINTDYQTLNASLKSLDNFIKTIEGIINIEKTKNERTLNKTLAIASVGISTASLAASTLTEQAEGIVKTIPFIPPNQINLWAFCSSFLLSLLIGLIGAAITCNCLNKGNKQGK